MTGKGCAASPQEPPQQPPQEPPRDDTPDQRPLMKLRFRKRSAAAISRLCSMITTVFPASTRRCRTRMSFSISAMCRPIVGSSRTERARGAELRALVNSTDSDFSTQDGLREGGSTVKGGQRTAWRSPRCSGRELGWISVQRREYEPMRWRRIVSTRGDPCSGVVGGGVEARR